MIQSFADIVTKELFDGKDSKATRMFGKNLWTVIRRKLDMVNAAHDLRDLSAVPGNDFKALKGGDKGLYQIRVNDQYRLRFRFENGNASDVQCGDFHT